MSSSTFNDVAMVFQGNVEVQKACQTQTSLLKQMRSNKVPAWRVATEGQGMKIKRSYILLGSDQCGPALEENKKTRLL